MKLDLAPRWYPRAVPRSRRLCASQTTLTTGAFSCGRRCCDVHSYRRRYPEAYLPGDRHILDRCQPAGVRAFGQALGRVGSQRNHAANHEGLRYHQDGVVQVQHAMGPGARRYRPRQDDRPGNTHVSARGFLALARQHGGALGVCRHARECPGIGEISRILSTLGAERRRVARGMHVGRQVADDRRQRCGRRHDRRLFRALRSAIENKNDRFPAASGKD